MKFGSQGFSDFLATYYLRRDLYSDSDLVFNHPKFLKKLIKHLDLIDAGHIEYNSKDISKMIKEYFKDIYIIYDYLKEISKA